jgi:hypothetical protein
MTGRCARLAVLLGSLAVLHACGGGAATTDGGHHHGDGGIVGLGPPCPANPTAHVAFNIESNIHPNDAIMIDQTTFSLVDTPAIYYAGSDVTFMEAANRDVDGHLGSHVELYFKGNKPASEELGTGTDGALQFDTVHISIFLEGESYLCCDDTTPDVYMGTISVTDYGPVGGLVQGSFEGMFDGYGSSAGDVGSATISNGSFAFTRCNDGQ